MSKLIITHISPDLDACSSVWLIKRYLPDWHQAQVLFVNAGKTFEDKEPDTDPSIIHVDTGLGMFDHHQFAEKLSAARRVLNHLLQQSYVKKKDIEGLNRFVDYVTLIDTFGEVHFPEPTADLYEFNLPRIIDGLKALLQDDHMVVEHVLVLCDAALISLKNKIHAEKELEQGVMFHTRWGKAIAIESKNDETMTIALKSGFSIVVRKETDTGFMRIKAFPAEHIDLSSLHKKVIKIDPKATWFFHASKHMLLNGSSKNKDRIPSSLSLRDIIEIMKEI